MNTTSRNGKALREQGQADKTKEHLQRNNNLPADFFPESITGLSQQSPPVVSGQIAEALSLIREYQPLLSFRATAEFVIPEFAARVHNLRALGFDVRTRIEPKVVFRDRERRNAAFYSLGVPEWPRPGFLDHGRAKP